MAVLSTLLAASASAQVGFAQFRSGSLPITVVYRTDAVATPQQFGPFDLEVAVDAVPSAGNGRLVVISHGSGGDAFTLHTLARTLALAGFVVAQPEHQGDNWQDRSDSGVVSWQRRPGEIAATIDAIAADSRFAAVLRLDKVGVYGVSAGGGTALALAGANWSAGTYQKHCAAHVKDDAGFCLYGLKTEAQRAARTRLYLEAAAQGSETMLAGPAVMDRRVAAVAASVPVAAIFTAQTLAAIRMPVGIVEAQADKVLNPIYHSGYVLAHCSACKQLDSVIGGGHFDTLSPWPNSVASAAAAAPGAQRNPAIDDIRRQVSYDGITAFFIEHLTR
jgi:predicted dienelactone hydrolase